MTSDKAELVLAAVLKKTETGKIPWQPLENEKIFEVSYPTETLRVGMEEGEDPSGEPYFYWYLEILNKQGRTIGKIDATDIITGSYNYNNMAFKKIFDLARDKALGVDKVVESLLNNLSEDVDDEIPF